MNIPLQKPLLPNLKAVAPYISRIDSSRWYANRGPLVREYEERLEELFGCYVCATSSCTMGMVSVYRALNPSWGLIYLPSWSFVATANAAHHAGLKIHLVDDGDFSDVSVCQFGGPLKRKDCDVLIDAAAAFDLYASKQATVGSIPVVISTHATKCFSTGEGGLALSTDKNFIERVRTIINHGIDDDRNVLVRGFNGKMSEYHAAVGLAALDAWDETRAKWIDAETRYARILGREARSFVSSLYPMEIERSVGPVMKYLNDNGVGSRKVWSDGIHKFPAYAGCRGSDMTRTDWLADHTLFLPFSVDMTDGQMEYVAQHLEKALQCA